MNKNYLRIGIALIFSISLLSIKAQNTLDFKWGVFTPVNNNLKNAFVNSNSFSISLLHAIARSEFSAGITFSHQIYNSKDQFFKPGYSSDLSIHNYLITGRYNFIHKRDLKLYAAIDAGLNRINNKATQNGINTEYKNSGITTSIAIGADVKISGRLSLGANIQDQYSYTHRMQFDESVHVNYLNCIAGNIGVSFLLGTKRTGK